MLGLLDQLEMLNPTNPHRREAREICALLAERKADRGLRTTLHVDRPGRVAPYDTLRFDPVSLQDR